MYKIVWNRFKQNKLAIVGLIIIIFVGIIALFAPIISPYNPFGINVINVLLPPNIEHPLGTDELGRDVLSRIIWGSRVSLSVGVISVGLSVFIGILIGAIAGFYGGKIDSFLMRFCDIILAFPTLFLILAIVTIVEPSLTVIMIVIGLTNWMDIARLVRAEFLSLKERDFVIIAKSYGVSDLRLIRKHILPNALSPVFVSATFAIGGAILIESGLSFLGLGVRPPNPSWGGIITSGKDNITTAWWLSLFPGIAIFLTVLSCNLIGESIRDAFDPRLWQSEENLNLCKRLNK